MFNFQIIYYSFYICQDPFDNNVNIEDNYESLLNGMTRKWYLTQLNHKVSASAADEFWKLGKEIWPKLMQAKEEESIRRKTPLFQNQRKKLSKELCPEVHMEFGFLNVSTGVTHKVSSHSTPCKEFDRNPEFIKLYEEAHIKVKFFD